MQFDSRSAKIIDLSKAKNMTADALSKELLPLYRLNPSHQQLSGFLNELALGSPAILRDLHKLTQLQALLNNIPIDFLGYLVYFLKIDVGKFRSIGKRINQFDYLFPKDLKQIMNAKNKLVPIKNVFGKMQMVLPLIKIYNRKLFTNEALRWIGYIPSLDSSSQKKLFRDLSTQLSEEVTRIKWQSDIDLLGETVPTKGNYGVLISLIDKKHLDISEAYCRTIRTPQDMERLLSALMTDCIAPGVLKVVGNIIKMVLQPQAKAQKYLEVLFEGVLKPILLPNLQCSKYFKQISEVITIIFNKRYQNVNVILQEKGIVPNVLHQSHSAEHANILCNLVNIWVTEGSRKSTISKIQKLLPIEKSARMRDQDKDKKGSYTSFTPKTVLTSSDNTFSQSYNQDTNKSTWLGTRVDATRTNNSTRMVEENHDVAYTDPNKIIMFQCDDYLGLPNVGNSCYINSFIQNLLFCKEFMAVLTKTDFQNKVYINLKKILFKLKQRDAVNLKDYVLDFKKELPALFSIDSTQQDSMEFGRDLINGMISLPQLKNVINQIFVTKTRTITKCPEGDVSSVIEQLSTEMILAFQNPTLLSKVKTNSVIQPVKMEDLLNGFFADSTIQGQFKCDKCKKKFKSCKREVELIELPQTLIIVLSRFTYDIELQRKRKILDVVPPEDYIHFGNIKTHSKIKSQYKLVSFVVHLGNQADSGHYQVYVKHPKEAECWVIFDDDNSVMQVNCQNAKALAKNLAVEQTPYILFYQRM